MTDHKTNLIGMGYNEYLGTIPFFMGYAVAANIGLNFVYIRSDERREQVGYLLFISGGAWGFQASEKYVFQIIVHGFYTTAYNGLCKDRKKRVGIKKY